MTQTELVEAIAQRQKIEKKDAAAALNGFVRITKEELLKGGEVKISGFGIFRVGKRAARMGRNPKTGVAVSIPESRTARFSPSKTLKDFLN